MGRLRAWMFAALAFGVFLPAMAQNLLFNPSGVRFAPMGVTARDFTSANGRYRVTIEQPNPAGRTVDEVKLIASMSKIDGSTATLMWSRGFTGMQVQFFRASDVMVSDNGDFVAAVTNFEDSLTLIKKDATFPIGRRVSGPSLFLSSPEMLAAIDDLEGEPIIRWWVRDHEWWVRDHEEWQAARIRDGTNIKVPPEAAARFNDTTRRDILSKLEAAERELLREKIKKIAAPLARFAGAPVANDWRGNLREIHYEFLATLRRPEDRRWIENLIESDEWHNEWFDWDPQADPFEFVSTDFVRQRADWLLGVWDQKVKRQSRDGRQSRSGRGLPRFTLGQVSGTVRFSTPINLVPAGSASLGSMNNSPVASFVRIFLFRDNDAERTGAKAEVESNHPITPGNARSNRRFATASPSSSSEDVTDEVRFAMTTVRPGRYRLKAIWDKRAPYMVTNTAGPGDYESAWSAPFEIKPAGIVSNIVLMCTNRAAGGETYYATDDWLARGWKVTGEFARFTFMPDSVGRQDLFSRNATQWITCTNTAPNTNWVQINRIGLRSYKMVRNTFLNYPDSLIVEFRRLAPNGRGLSLPSEGVAILDAHGCKYAISYSETTPRSVCYVFNCFPRSAKTWRLVGLTGTPGDTAIAFDYSVTNLVQTQRRELPNSELPLELNLERVKLKIFSVGREYREPTIESSLFDGSESSESWHIQETTVADAHGNFINPKEICREEKSFRVLGVVGRREPQLVTVPFEFAVAREEPKK